VGGAPKAGTDSGGECEEEAVEDEEEVDRISRVTKKICVSPVM